MDGTFQRGNKIRLDGASVQNHHIELKGSNYVVSAYMSIENTGNSYNIKPLADNMDLHTGGASDTKQQPAGERNIKMPYFCMQPRMEVH